jgi:hypothetical protein
MFCGNWPEDVESDATYAGKEVRQFCSRRQADERKTLRVFPEFITNGTLSSVVKGVERNKNICFLMW